jgi:hypothetical protein
MLWIRQLLKGIALLLAAVTVDDLDGILLHLLLGDSVTRRGFIVCGDVATRDSHCRYSARARQLTKKHVFLPASL